MSKWESKQGIESKSQLKAHRDHLMNRFLMENDLNLLQYPFWSQADKDLEATLWKEADNDYETRKVALRPLLNALSAEELTTYFQEIGVPENNVEDYLPESPV